MADNTSRAVESEELELEEIERRVARLSQAWMQHIVWEFEELGTGDLPMASERAAQVIRVFDALDRTLTAARHAREVLT